MESSKFDSSGVSGQDMYEWCTDLFPINRSITGDGVRKTLSYIKDLLPELIIKEVSSRSTAFDWVIPDEWNVTQAYVEDLNGQKVIDFRNNNLHLVGYSIPQNRIVERDELEEHLFSLENQPDAIPYVTSYYSRNWGFCLTHNQRKELPSGPFSVYIDSTLEPGIMNYGEILIKGDTEKEILLTTYVCHPSMANNELSGPAVLIKLAKMIYALEKRRYSYRILFLVETIGSIHYISQNLKTLKKNVEAGFVITCVGDNRVHSYVPTRSGNTLTDRVAIHVMKGLPGNKKYYTWLDRGSDERQFNAPGIDLPIGSLMRSKYGEYPEYHTSLDDLNLISKEGLAGGFQAIWSAVKILERNGFYRVKTLCEPQLGKRGLYPNTSIKSNFEIVQNRMNIISYLGGDIDLLDVANLCEVDFEKVWEIITELLAVDLVERISS